MEAEKEFMLKMLEESKGYKPPKSFASKVRMPASENWKKHPAYKKKAPVVPVVHTGPEYVGIDCEMLSTVDNVSELCRVSIVDIDGNVLFDEMVKPRSKVVNYRTMIHGITPKMLHRARSFEKIKADVMKIIEGKILIGHAIGNDLKALELELPEDRYKDTQKLYKHSHGKSMISLQKLALAELNKAIQTLHHSSIEDARTTIAVYKKLYLETRPKPRVRKSQDI
jgi:DNA polymerase III epsilon subunit-like protein